MTAPTVMKVEVEMESCCVCGAAGGELLAPDEYDAAAPPLQPPLRTMLLALTHNKVLPPGRLCGGCIQRAADAYEFSVALSARAPPLSEKIRALRRRLHELTQKIDVFIVVGGPGAGAGGTYSEDDIIMVEKDALAAAAAADQEDLQHARNTRGDTVYQCSVCPLSFQRVSEYREHVSSHPEDALHSCWTCGAQFTTSASLREHAREHAAPAPAPACPLCGATFSSAAELRRHEAGCAPRCPACSALAADRDALAQHAAARHGRDAPPPYVCPACFRTFPAPDLFSAHLLRHRQAKQFVCGYGACVMRFAARHTLMSHIRKCHASELGEEAAGAEEGGAGPGAQVPCDQCDRTFGSAAAMKRHARVHRPAPAPAPAPVQYQLLQEEVVDGEGVVQYVMSTEEGMEVGVGEGEVEYLEVETLEDADYGNDEQHDATIAAETKTEIDEYV